MYEKSGMSLLEFGDNLFCDDLRNIVHNHPYLSFVLLSATLEYIGKCLSSDKDIFKQGQSEKNCYNAINSILALSKYKKFNRCKANGKKNTNLLYTELRCGMVHSLVPKTGVILSDNKNELEKNVVGCKDLYEDLCNAWKEIKGNEAICSFLTGTKCLRISETIENT